MRIPFPVRLKIRHAVAFAVSVLVLQQVAGSDLRFSMLFFLYILLSTLAFNAAGGFAYPSGAFVFFFSTLSAIIGLTYKALLFEPAESHLHSPFVTMTMYCASMAIMWFLAALTKRLTPRVGLLAGMDLSQSMKKAAAGALLVGMALQVVSFFPQTPGSFLAALRQINNFSLVAILLATYHEVQITGGRRSSNWIVWTGVVWNVFLGGVLSFSKQGWLTAPLAWLVAAITAGHNFSRKQLLCIVAGAFCFQIFLAPYSQIGRNLRGDTSSFADDWRVAKGLISNLEVARSAYEESAKSSAEQQEQDIFHLYDRPQGFMDRLNMLAPDDALITYTLEGNYEGLGPTIIGFTNAIPHFIWPNKPSFYTGNEYGREVGIIDSEDVTTGISFTPSADAFHQVGWYGLLILAGVVFLLFMVMDSLSGDVRRAPWGLLFVVTCAHFAPEGLIPGQIYVATITAFGVSIVALTTKYVLPVLSGVLTNTERTRVQMSRISGPRHLRPGPLHQPTATPGRQNKPEAV